MSEYSDIAGSDDIIIVNCDTQETFKYKDMIWVLYVEFKFILVKIPIELRKPIRMKVVWNESF